MSMHTFEEAFEVVEKEFNMLGSMVKDNDLMQIVKHLMGSVYYLGIKTWHMHNRQHFGLPDKGEDFITGQGFFV